MSSTKLEDPKEQDELDAKAGIKSATDVLQTLSKAIKTLKIYPDTSPLRQKFVAELTGKFSKFLDEYGDLILRIKQTEMSYQGEVVYSHPSKEENIAFRLFGDGIREIIFTEGLEEKEILDFIDAITRDCSREGDDDVVTLLWEKDFKNIRHIVVEEEKEGEKELAATEQASTAGKSREALLNAYKSEAVSEQQGTTILEPAGVELEIEHIYGKPFSEIFALTPEEIERVQCEMDKEEGMDLISELLDILFHILQIEKEIESYTEIMTNIEKAIKSLALSGDYRRIIPILTTLKTLSKEENNFSRTHAQVIQTTIDALGEEEFLQQFALSINVSKSEDTDALFSFLSMLNKNAVAPLAAMIGALDQMKTRRLFCDVLALIAKENIEPLLRKIGDNNWFVVRNIVYILGKIGDPKSVSYLKKIKDHDEPRIRKEIVHTLTEIKSAEAKDLLISFLKDNNSAVRMMALKNLSTLNYRKAVPHLLNIISGDGFDSKEVIEKREFFDALGILGTNEVLPFLKETLMKRSWLFGKSKIEEQRVYTVLALKRLSTPEAIAILREGSSSSDKGIQKICEDALQEIEKEKR
ncbi:MAG: HEAT repeat domain-containing protein [Nitrospirae bacterium]|nr:HEAT repeat domain-containing protein [Nitrospirota bacterium]